MVFLLEGGRVKDTAGLTLVELMVVIAIVGIIVAVGVNYSTQTQNRYTVESYTKRISATLMQARSDAARTNIQYRALLTANQVQIHRDNDGDSVVDAGEPLLTIPYPSATITWNVLDPTIIFDRRGLVTQGNQTIRIINPNAAPGTDCIVVAATRINIGRWNSDPVNPNTCGQK